MAEELRVLGGLRHTGVCPVLFSCGNIFIRRCCKVAVCIIRFFVSSASPSFSLLGFLVRAVS